MSTNISNYMRLNKLINKIIHKYNLVLKKIKMVSVKWLHRYVTPDFYKKKDFRTIHLPVPVFVYIHIPFIIPRKTNVTLSLDCNLSPLLITIAISESITIKATSKPFFVIILFGQAVNIPQIKHKKQLAEKFKSIMYLYKLSKV